MHLVRAIANLKEWFLKERIVQLIVNKYRDIQIYKSRENIKLLHAYAAAVVTSVVNEYKSLKLTLPYIMQEIMKLESILWSMQVRIKYKL